MEVDLKSSKWYQKQKNKLEIVYAGKTLTFLIAFVRVRLKEQFLFANYYEVSS